MEAGSFGKVTAATRAVKGAEAEPASLSTKALRPCRKALDSVANRMSVVLPGTGRRAVGVQARGVQSRAGQKANESHRIPRRTTYAALHPSRVSGGPYSPLSPDAPDLPN